MKPKIIIEKKSQIDSGRYKINTKNLLVIIHFLILFVSFSKAQTWKQTNGPFGGEVTNLAVHPNGDLYTAVNFPRGLFRSTDNGDSWNCIGFTDQIVKKIFIANSGYIFLHLHYPDGLFRSTDDGATWHQLNLSGSYIIGFEDDGIGNIYIIRHLSSCDVYRSSDGGDHWVLWSQFNQGFINDLLFYDDNNYIFRTDGGNAIFRMINNDWVQYAIIPYSCNITCIEVTSNGVLLVGLGTRYTQVKGIFRSLDNGVTWQQVFSNNIENSDINQIVVNSAGIIFAGTSNGVFKSTDDGSSWNQIGLQCSIISTLVCANSSFVITGSYGGLRRWNDPEHMWEDINLGLFVQATYSLAYDQTNQNYVAATSNGVFYTSNQGETWHHTLQTVLQSQWMGDIVFDGNPDFLYANGYDLGTNTGKLYRSPDKGVTWELLDFPVDFIHALMTTSIPGELWCGSYYGNIHYSSDYGVSWTEKFSVPSAIKCFQSGNIQGYMFAGTDGGFYRSTNSGNTWREFNIGLLNYSVESIAMNSAHDIFIGTQDGIYRSEDLAGNWQFVGLYQETVSAIAINSLDYILAGTRSGHIFISTDNGESWNNFSTGLNTSEILSIVLDENDFAMVGTISSGAYRSLNSTVDIRESDNSIVTSFDLFQNYPNPFNPNTMISYQLPVSSEVMLKVYDILGNEVTTLVDEYNTAGKYEVEFNASALPSGVYFYQLKAGEFVQTRKMLLIK